MDYEQVTNPIFNLMSSIRQRLIHGFSANGFGQLVNIVVQLCSVPIYIRFWGLDLYGEWLLLSTIPAYLALTDMGFSSVTGNQMTMLVAAGDRRSALESFQSAWVFVSLMCLAVMGIVVLMTVFPIDDWLNLTEISDFQLDSVLTFLGLAVVLNLQTGLLSAGFRATGHYARGIWLSNFIWLSEFIALISGLALGAGPIAIAGLMVSVRALGYLLERWQLRRVATWVVVGWKHAKRTNVVEMSRPAVAFMGFPTGNAIKSQGMLTVVGLSLGPDMVVPFNTMRTLVNSAHQAMGIVNSAVWPEMSRAFGAGNTGLARNLHRMACKASFWLAVLVIIFLMFLGEDILRIWTLGKVKLEPGFFYLMLLVMIVNSLWFTSSIVMASINRHETMAVIYLSACLTSVLLAYGLIYFFELRAIPIALLIIDIVMAVYVLQKSLNLVEDNPLEFMTSMIPRSVK